MEKMPFIKTSDVEVAEMFRQAGYPEMEKEGNSADIAIFDITKELSDEDIVTEDIKLTNDQILHLSAKTRYSLAKLCEICQNEEELIELNGLFRAYKNDAFFANGNIIGKKSEIIIIKKVC